MQSGESSSSDDEEPVKRDGKGYPVLPWQDRPVNWRNQVPKTYSGAGRDREAVKPYVPHSGGGSARGERQGAPKPKPPKPAWKRPSAVRA